VSSAASTVCGKSVEGAKSVPQALKRGHILNDLMARVKLVPFPLVLESKFFRKLFGRAYPNCPSQSWNPAGNG
jgi:hypothetical protein